jgi:hypothetical protein
LQACSAEGAADQVGDGGCEGFVDRCPDPLVVVAEDEVRVIVG